MKMMFRVEAGAVREQLHRLVNAGVLDRVALGVYALKACA
jgi:predicted transcriptional regulator of viral defense system